MPFYYPRWLYSISQAPTTLSKAKFVVSPYHFFYLKLLSAWRELTSALRKAERGGEPLNSRGAGRGRLPLAEPPPPGPRLSPGRRQAAPRPRRSARPGRRRRGSEERQRPLAPASPRRRAPAAAGAPPGAVRAAGAVRGERVGHGAVPASFLRLGTRSRDPEQDGSFSSRTVKEL